LRREQVLGSMSRTNTESRHCPPHSRACLAGARLRARVPMRGCRASFVSCGAAAGHAPASCAATAPAAQWLSGIRRANRCSRLGCCGQPSERSSRGGEPLVAGGALASHAPVRGASSGSSRTGSVTPLRDAVARPRLPACACTSAVRHVARLRRRLLLVVDSDAATDFKALQASCQEEHAQRL
jgi:hypothetical protein